jgi:hypothetical protein
MSHSKARTNSTSAPGAKRASSARKPAPNSDQIALPLTESEQKDSRRQLQSLHPGNRMRLMFGQPLLPQEPPSGPSR